MGTFLPFTFLPHNSSNSNDARLLSIASIRIRLALTHGPLEAGGIMHFSGGLRRGLKIQWMAAGQLFGGIHSRMPRKSPFSFLFFPWVEGRIYQVC
jgi:hypothetical protein